MDFITLLKKDFIIIDGAFGTEIQKYKKTPYDIPELLNFTDTEMIKKIVKSYVDNGSEIVCANTFGANKYKLSKYEKTVDEVIKQAISITKEAVNGKALVALDVSVLGQLLEPSGTLTFEKAYEAYKEIMTAGEKHGADLVLIETMTDLYEMKAALLACKENTSLPVICSMTFEENHRTFTGCSAESMAYTLEGLGADVIGVNCSLGPGDLINIVDILLKATNLPLMVKPNAGLPDPFTNEFSLSKEDFALQMKEFAKRGVKILGGCCGTNPEYIKELCGVIKGVTPEKREKISHSTICSSSIALKIDRPLIVGERINPTGKKLFKEALKENNIGYILGQAIEQVDAGADILDVNVGLPEINEEEVMVRVVKALQGVTGVPLQIDSTKPNVIESALRVYNGKAIVNSVNGEDQVLNTILPIVKKYGASIVGLTLDNNGIPQKAEERYKIAEKILNSALALGIPKENVFIDCLTLTASTEQNSVFETLKALKMVKEKLGLKTMLGVSNISFGLPNRELVNSTFLTMALNNGLDLPIMNPNNENMTGAVRAYRLLSGYDLNSVDYIEAYSGQKNNKSQTGKLNEVTLEYAISKGLKVETANITRELLDIYPPMDIIRERLIPTLDEIGIKFEQGKLFLPQLILAAETAGVSFDVLKLKMAEQGENQKSRGKIVLATVKGDIHDIGKNIVKVLLENYGFDIIDLGRDVPPELIAKTVEENKILLCGLSALMTTTLPAMEETIKLIKKSSPECKIMVGGAVLNPEYAKRIEADFYAKDAKSGADIAKAVFY